MKPVKTPTLIAAAFLLTACAGSTGSVDLRLDSPPPALAADCARPSKLPAAALTQERAEHYWRRDRAALVQCGKSKAALRDFYADRDARLRGGK